MLVIRRNDLTGTKSRKIVSESHVRGRSREAANSRLNGRHASSGCRYMSPPPSIYTTWTMHVRVNLDTTETKEFPTARSTL